MAQLFHECVRSAPAASPFGTRRSSSTGSIEIPSPDYEFTPPTSSRSSGDSLNVPSHTYGRQYVVNDWEHEQPPVNRKPLVRFAGETTRVFF
jgi:hypothetical protein